MKILVAGGFLGKSENEQARLRPAPEAVLAGQLRDLGQDVRGIGLKDWLAFFNQRFDVVHIHHMSKMAVLAALVSRKMVFTHHSSEYASSVARRLAEWIIWARAAQVVCLSETDEREKLARFPYLRGRTCVIPNGALPAAVVEHPRAWGEGSGFVIAVVGQLIELKRVHLAIESLTKLPSNFVLELTYHNDLLAEELKVLAKRLGVHERVRFLGRAAGDELAERYRRAHLLLLPSRTEALPSVVSEALMASLPVVATAVGAVESQVGSAGVCIPLSESSYHEAILAVSANYGTFATLAHSRGAELRRWTPERMAMAHLDLYHLVAARRKTCV